MKLTTKDIIKYLPFEEEFKTKLLESWDTMEMDLKCTIEQVLWDAYDGMYDLKLKENIELGLIKAREKNEMPGPEFYKQIEAQTDKEMQSETYQKAGDAELSQVRSRLEALIGSPASAQATTPAPVPAVSVPEVTSNT